MVLCTRLAGNGDAVHALQGVMMLWTCVLFDLRSELLCTVVMRTFNLGMFSM